MSSKCPVSRICKRNLQTFRICNSAKFPCINGWYHIIFPTVSPDCILEKAGLQAAAGYQIPHVQQFGIYRSAVVSQCESYDNASVKTFSFFAQIKTKLVLSVKVSP